MSVRGRSATRDGLLATIASVLAISGPFAAHAQEVQAASASASDPDTPSLREIVERLKNQERELAAQKRLLRDQQRTIEQLKGQLAQATGQPPRRAASGSGVPNLSQSNPQTPQIAQNMAPEPSPPGPPVPSVPSANPPSANAQTNAAPAPGEPRQPVGEAPEKAERPPEVAALVDVGGVLTPRGHLVIEPFTQYEHVSNSNFTFEGVQIVSALEIGEINAGQDKHDIFLSGVTARYGITNRLEIEARVPYVYRSERLIGTLVNQNNVTTTQNAHGDALGDIEAIAHYQINDGHDDWPFFIGNLRFKSDTGTAPYDVNYTDAGFPRSLPTGSGFPAFEPSVTIIYPSDPAVLYGNLGWIKSFGGTVNRQIGTNAVGFLAPGDTYVASFGMGLALNDRLSFTLGFENDYIRPSSQIINGTKEQIEALEVGELLFGMAFRVNNRVAANVQLAVGATRDAPDLSLTLRVPLSFEVCHDDGFFC